jgi:hypothetical protein
MFPLVFPLTVLKPLSTDSVAMDYRMRIDRPANSQAEPRDGPDG